MYGFTPQKFAYFLRTKERSSFHPFSSHITHPFPSMLHSICFTEGYQRILETEMDKGKKGGGRDKEGLIQGEK